MVVFYKKLKKVQLNSIDKKQIDLNNRKMRNHPASPGGVFWSLFKIDMFLTLCFYLLYEGIIQAWLKQIGLLSGMVKQIGLLSGMVKTNRFVEWHG